MILVLRPLARLLTFLILVVLAAIGLAVAFVSIGGSGDFSLPGLADLVGLPSLRDEVGRLLAAVEADGPVAALSALAGLGAIALGILLLFGALAPQRERLLVLDRSDQGTVAARRKPLSQVAATIAEQTRGVTASKAKLRAARGERGGRLAVRASHPLTADARELAERTRDALDPLSDAFGLKTRVRARVGGPGERVQ